MGRYIIKLSDKRENFYLEWSTIIDAPTTYGMSLEEFKEYYKEQYGNEGMQELPTRLERVERTGCSGHDATLDDLLSCNRAGNKEGRISKKEIIKRYCLERSVK